MQLLGKKSLASKLLTLVNLALILVFIGLIGMVIFVSYFLLAEELPAVASSGISLQGPGLIVHLESEGALEIGYSFFTTQLLLAIPLILMVLFILYKLRFILSSLKNENPFSPDNPVHIRHIGYGIIATVVVSSIAEGIAGYHLSPIISEKFPQLSWQAFSPDLTGIFFGLLILILSEVFRQGTELKKDQEFTV